MTEEELLPIIDIRHSIGDPITTDFIFLKEPEETTEIKTEEDDEEVIEKPNLFPESPLQNVAYTTGNGEYKYWDGIEWRNYLLKFSDNYIKMLSSHMGRFNASIRLINNLIAQIDPTDYITSGNAGGQSVSFLSLSEILQYYQTLKETLLEEQAAEEGTNSGLMLKTKRRAVGGVIESDE